ncbi:hypothetical protein DEU56DRAFT_759207 [Suillus clintonianus]|uniref:uncharacterized protein n=1 Tax=Suillus clintonianus TaxID=1904413 RepID=UPI001B877F5B|nr:uncharacterized protein DEU56DRAFT_759207 [Suillus clintonianus]KAG2125468.1 hypothetical protein DEU56DRAFT_759207 [Suillus clintonianus]
MERIASDPALEAQPNFESAAYRGWLTALTNGGLGREEALAQMVEDWGLEHQKRINLWRQQVEEEARELREQAEHEKAEKDAEEQEERREAEKKKPKINDFDAEITVADIIIPRPSQYAIQKVKSMEYVELWYFSPDGCREAAMTSRSTSDSDDAFGFARVDGMVALKTIASFKASQKAVQDHDLSWRQFDLAKTSFLIHIEKNGWPEKHQQALALFFTLITNHEHRMRPRGEKTLLRYAGFVRREWHDRLSQNQGFNIGIFNSALYSSISDDVWEAERDEGLKLLQSALPTSALPVRHRGREASENRGKRVEPTSSPGSNRYHPYRAVEQATKKPHKGQQSFQPGAGQSGPSACALCLGRFRHPIHKCASEFLWDKRTKTRCRRGAEGHLVNPEGLELCYDWQRPKGCSSTARSHVHKCSGCGAKDHGAQECPQSESI